ncbi:hypothetical protein [Rufibacter ruber]|uniref:hypothetical protein n=1 Tax=Rufibacter ruber TaxID=1783499 RepID=UPI0012907A54|nr:hypothetical protein [Rufibacter ruber]
MFKFAFCAANGYQKNLTLPFSRTIAGRMLLKKRFARTFRSPFSLAKSKCKQALRRIYQFGKISAKGCSAQVLYLVGFYFC